MRLHPFYWVWPALTVAALLLFGGPVSGAEVQGKITKIVVSQQLFVVTDDDDRDHTFQMMHRSKITVGDLPGRLADLQAGDTVTVLYQEDEDLNIVITVRRK